MINISPSTQTWSASSQKSALKADRQQQDSAAEYQNAYGDKDIGEVLNKVADPNWVDPAKMRKVGSNELDRDAFLKLLLTQLKYQDPTNPMQNHEMAAQLAQFSSLESLSNIDRGIGDLAKAANPKNDFGALGLIGKMVSGDSSRISRTEENEKHDIVYDLSSDASEVKVSVLDLNNQPVKEFSFRGLKRGRNEVNWDGSNGDGLRARPGEYRVQFEAIGPTGTKVAVKTGFEGTISGVNFTPQGPLLLMGNQSVRLSEVKKIIDPNISPNRSNDNSSAPVVKSLGSPQVPKTAQANSLPPPGAGNLETVGMSRGMINQMKKQGIEAGL